MINYWVIPGLKPNDFDAEFALQTILKTLNLNREQLNTPFKDQEVIDAKHIFCYMAKRHSTLKLREIAATLNYADHMVVGYGVKKVKNIMDCDKDFRLKVQKIENTILYSEGTIKYV